MNIPFTIYDFFAYLSSGSILLIIFDYLFGNSIILQDEVSAPLIFLFVLLSYIIGHVIANLSSSILENIIIGKILDRPIKILFDSSPNKFWKIIFPGYHRKLPQEVIVRMKKQAEDKGFGGEGEALFYHAFSHVSQHKELLNRLDEFRNLYGFARNLTLSLLLGSIAFFIKHFSDPSSTLFAYGLAALILAVAMFYRYLKFYRQYSVQLFITYSELPKIDTSA